MLGIPGDHLTCNIHYFKTISVLENTFYTILSHHKNNGLKKHHIFFTIIILSFFNENMYF